MKLKIFLLLSIIAIEGIVAQTSGKIIVVRDSVDYAPLEFHEGGKLTGFHVELVNEVAASIGLTVDWMEVPWVRAQKMVEAGEADGITYISPTPERSKWAIFSDANILTSGSFNFLIRADSKDTMKYTGNAEEFLKNRTLLVIRGFNLPEAITKANPKCAEAPTMTNMIDMLLAKRNDVAIINYDDFIAAFKGTPAETKLMMLDPPVSSFKNYIAFTLVKNSTGLSEKFGKAMIAFKKTARYGELKKKYGQ